jgi:hypothetical protein
MPVPNRQYSVLNPNVTEFFGQPLYDTVNYAAAGQAAMNFFAIPRGQAAVLTTAVGGAPAAGTIKSYRDTNLDIAGFTPDKRYEFIGMNFAFRRVVAGVVDSLVTDEIDRKLIIGNTWWHFRIGDKDILYLPTIFAPCVNNPVATTWGATRADNIGGGAMIYMFTTPLTINPGERISVILESPGNIAITTTLDMTLMLHGTMQRST